MTDAPEKFPPERWFAAVADGREHRVAFRDINGDVEFVEADWIEENVFVLRQSPLLVDGVAVCDYVEVEWREGDAEPHFLRRQPGDEWSYRPIRARVTKKEVKRFLKDCDDFRYPFVRPRYERGILATAIRQSAIDYYRDMERDILRALPGDWAFTDIGPQE